MKRRYAHFFVLVIFFCSQFQVMARQGSKDPATVIMNKGDLKVFSVDSVKILIQHKDWGYIASLVGGVQYTVQITYPNNVKFKSIEGSIATGGHFFIDDKLKVECLSGFKLRITKLVPKKKK